ncbi:MAG: hypothetical protein IJ762_04875 [Bacteroidaceae bacterium]|nr:hypothetical protein [Bacteroidaceae bacterium]
MTMKWKLCIISLLTLVSLRTMADDSIYVKPSSPSRYDRRVNRYRKNWGALIPTLFVFQNAGNMGTLSGGIGWDYGRRKQWETELMFGFVPKHQSHRTKVTMTLKENYLPWSIGMKHGWSIEPLSASFYLNTIFGHEFWKQQPSRYPKGYYKLLSTRVRVNIAIGQHITWQIPQERRHMSRSISLFYEVSTCDWYIVSKVVDWGGIPLRDIVGLSFGVKFQTL